MINNYGNDIPLLLSNTGQMMALSRQEAKILKRFATSDKIGSQGPQPTGNMEMDIEPSISRGKVNIYSQK